MSTKPKATTTTKPEGAIVPKETRLGGFLMTQGTQINPEEWEDKSLPPILKPKDFPTGAVLVGRIVSIHKTDIPDSKKNGAIIVLETANGKCAVPVTTVIERAIEAQNVGTDKNDTKAPAVSTPFIGRDIMIKALGETKSNKKGHRDFWNFDVKIKKEA